MKRLMEFLAILGIICFTSAFPASAKIKVVTSIPDLKDITERIGGDKVSVFSLAKGYQNPHMVDLKPSFMVQLSKANLFMVLGLELEIWDRDLLEGARNLEIMRGASGYVDCSEGIHVLEVPAVVGRQMGDIHPLGNPHYNLDPLSGKAIAKNICRALSRKYPQYQDYFQGNLEKFNGELDAKYLKWKEEAASLKGLKVIAYHQSWVYFAHRFGLDIVGLIEPRPGIPPSPADVARTIETAKNQSVKVIIMEPYFEDRIPNLIAQKTRARVVKLPNMVGGLPGADNYFSLFDFIIGKLVKAADQG
jgi:ABC-type Zn uptake system ZnuABC Zn-binding protein ZnuA